eukprot:6460-Heterococcus_DN1.PRE.2
MGGAASTLQDARVCKNYCRQRHPLCEQVSLLLKTLQLNEQQAGSLFGAYARCSPELKALVTWDKFAEAMCIFDQPFQQRCYAKFKSIERAEEGLDVIELLYGLYELCSKTPPQIINFIFDMYATPGDADTEVPAVLHGADLKAMLKEVHFRTAEQKAAAHEKAHAEKGRMMDLVSTAVCLVCLMTLTLAMPSSCSRRWQTH